MTFNEFCEMLYTFTGQKRNKHRFVIDLIDNIIGDTDKNLFTDSSPSLIEKIYNGTRNISERNARTIISDLDKEKFSDYLLENSSVDVINLIRKDLKKKEIDVSNDDREVCDKCAELFESILLDIVQKKSEEAKKSTGSSEHTSTTVELRHILPKIPRFFGRKHELKKLVKILDDSNYAVLSGFGGIGKSFTALIYAYDSLKNSRYSIIQHLVCGETDSLRTAVEKLEFDGINNKGLKFDDIILKLKNIKQPVLVIFDNVYKQPEQDYVDDFQKLMSCGNRIKFIFTTRIVGLLGCNRDNEMFIEPMGDKALLKLYTYHRFSIIKETNNKYKKECEEDLIELFRMVGSHTLVIVLLAKLNNRYIEMGESVIKEKLKNGLRSLSNNYEVSIEKDEVLKKGSVIEIIKTILKISMLTESQIGIIKHLALIPSGGMGFITFKELAGYNDQEIISIVKSGWVDYDEGYKKLSLHPLIEEVIFDNEDLAPDFNSCNYFFFKILEELENLEEDNIWNGLLKIANYAVQKSGLYNSNDKSIIEFVRRFELALIRIQPMMHKSLLENPIIHGLKDEHIGVIESLKL